jgi:16S rRNA (adenine1518-N6/adenine1519-N6)-dimethyltransferase
MAVVADSSVVLMGSAGSLMTSIASHSDSTDGLLGADDIHALAAQAHISPTKKLGQNFMIDPQAIEKIVRLSGTQAGDQVVEVGPGLGSLTLGLLKTGAHVTAIEIDPRLAQLLPQTVERFQPGAESRLHVVLSDALQIKTPEQLTDIDPSKPFALVSNLPYNVATPILLTFLARFPQLASALVLVQNEVADRLTASPGSRIYGVPSLKLAWFGVAHKAGRIARSVFWPVPNVDSSLVAFHRSHAWMSALPTVSSAADPSDDSWRTTTFTLIDRAFAQRRKTLRAALKHTASSEQIQAAGIDPQVRGEKLGIADFARLATVIQRA